VRSSVKCWIPSFDTRSLVVTWEAVFFSKHKGAIDRANMIPPRHFNILSLCEVLAEPFTGGRVKGGDMEDSPCYPRSDVEGE
jgi:hypothetical protein